MKVNKYCSLNFIYSIILFLYYTSNKNISFTETGDSYSPYQGEAGSYGLRGDDDNLEDRQNLQPWGGTRRRTRRPMGDNLENRFVELDLRARGNERRNPQAQRRNPQAQPTYPHPPEFSYYPPPPQHYYPPIGSYYYPPHPPEPSYNTVSSTENYPHGYMVLPVPQGYFPQQGASNESSNFGMGASNSSTSHSNYFGYEPHERANNDDDDIEILRDPPRHSFWW